MKTWRNDALIAAGVVALFAASFAVYWPALHGAFIWDDLMNIDRNPLIRADDGLLKIWRASSDTYDFYPLTWTTWWLEWRAWGRNTLGYHVLNVLLHAGAAAMLWRVLVRLKLPGAYVAAFVFAVHPVNVESVAWITERKNTLSMLMVAVSVALYLDWRRGGEKRLLYWASVGFFALALLAKPSPVLLPVVLLLLAWSERGTLTRADARASVPFFAISAAVALVTVLIHHSRGIASAVVRTDGFLGRTAGAGWCVWFYLDKLVRPVDLSFVYPRWKIDPGSPLHWLPLAALLATLVALFLLRSKIGRGPVVALAGFVAILLPVLGFLDIYFFRYAFVADHWQYHASIIMIAFLVAAAGTLLARLGRPGRTLGAVAACGVVMWLGGRSWQEAHHYTDEVAVWRNAVEENPGGAMPLSNYASLYLLPSGQRAEARAAYRRAIELDPDFTEAYLSLGATYVRENPQEAIRWYTKALDTPFGGKDPNVHLGDLYFSLGETAQAITWYERALERVNGREGFLDLLPSLHEEVGNTERAIQLYRSNAAQLGEEVEPWFALGTALVRHGRGAEGHEALEKARLLAVNDHVQLNSMGTRLVTARRFAAAESMLREAVRARPDYGPAYNNLGKALEGGGKIDEAEAAFAEAVDVQPGFQEAKDNLDRTRAAREKARR